MKKNKYFISYTFIDEQNNQVVGNCYASCKKLTKNNIEEIRKDLSEHLNIKDVIFIFIIKTKR